MLDIHTYIQNSRHPKIRGEKSFSPHFSHRLAFTLAEVLIVLGIIGVVAELTLPTLMNNVDTGVYRAGLKESFSTLSQAYTSIQTDNSGSIVNACATNDSDCLANLFKPYLRVTTSISGVPSSTNMPNCWNNSEMFDPTETHTCLVLNNGMSVDFDMEMVNCIAYCAIINVDVNGLKKPNKWGKDRYGFVLYDDSLKTGGGSCTNGTGAWTDSWGCSSTNIYK